MNSAESTPALKKYVCHRVVGKIAIDGKLDEDAWTAASPLWNFWRYVNPDIPSSYADGHPGPAASLTNARMLWDDNFLYIAAEMKDYDLYATIAEHDAATWHNDTFEIFLRPNEASPGYYEFHVTPINTTLDLFLPRRNARQFNDSRKFESAITTAVQIQGTINNPDDKDSGWSIEMRIPFSSIMGGCPSVGEEWRFSVCRYDYSKYLPDTYAYGYELSSSSRNLTLSGFHHIERYDILLFMK